MLPPLHTALAVSVPRVPTASSVVVSLQALWRVHIYMFDQGYLALALMYGDSCVDSNMWPLPTVLSCDTADETAWILEAGTVELYVAVG